MGWFLGEAPDRMFLMDSDLLSLWKQSKIDDFALETAQSSLELASKQNQELSQESRHLYDEFYDKILLYSAGAFSFSVALIGLVVGDRIAALSKVGLIFPNVYWLYVSLTGYLVTCALVLIARRFDAAYAAYFGMHLYCDRKKKEQEARLAKLKNYPGEILVTNSGTREGEIQKCGDNIAELEGAVAKNARGRDRSYNLKRICHLVAEVTVSLATLLLLLFTIQLTQAIIWG